MSRGLSKGKTYPSEATTRIDSKTGIAIRQVTSHPSVQHHPFYYLPAYDDAMQWLFFVSHRTGNPQIFTEERESKKLIQLTDRQDLNEWSVHPAHDGTHIYFTAGARALRLSLETLKEEVMADFGDSPMREKGMVGAAMGTTTLSRDDKWWAVPVKIGEEASQLKIIETGTGRVETILERDTIGHPQFHPDDSSLLRYAGPFYERMWIIQRDGSNNHLVYKRDTSKKEWIVHETWMPGRRELLTTCWPHGVIGVHVDSGEVRRVASFNIWHPMVDRAGTRMVTDTRNPDIGLRIFDPRIEQGDSQELCYPEASNAGEHWNTDHCPYDDGPVQVYAPQHTHPHPNFSPDGRQIVFTTDRTGHAQVCEVVLEDA